jgi:hypothetical protein
MADKPGEAEPRWPGAWSPSETYYMLLKTGKVLSAFAGKAIEVLSTIEPSDPPDVSATLATWFLDCPGQSPAWRHYVLSVIHLRPIEGVKPAHIRLASATHEVIVCALDPKENPVPDNLKSWNFLRPINVTEQLVLPSDKHVIDISELLVWGVLSGVLWAEPPLSGQREPWQRQMRLMEAHAAGKHFN